MLCVPVHLPPVCWSMHRWGGPCTPMGLTHTPPKCGSLFVAPCTASSFTASSLAGVLRLIHACCPAGGSAHVRTEVQGQCKNWACQVSFCLLLFPLQGLQQLLKIFTFLLCCLISWHICFWSCFVTPWSLQSSSLLSCLSPSSQPRVRLQLGLQALQRSPALQSRSEPVLQEDL